MPPAERERYEEKMRKKATNKQLMKRAK